MTTKTKKVIAEVLTVSPDTRDDDVLLFMSVCKRLWLDSNDTAYSLLNTVDYSYVVRQRALLQSKHEDLRWQKYIERQEKWHRLKKVYSPSFWDKIQLTFG